MKVTTIAISNFVRRQTPESQFSHWNHFDEGLLGIVQSNMDKAVPGYKPGVILVPVPPEGFFSNVVHLKDGDMLIGFYAPRRPGEVPRKQMFVLNGEKMPAARVDVVLYHHDVLAENNDQSSDAEWEIISVNAEVSDGGQPAPMTAGTLMANHFQESGGTATGMSAEEFEDALKTSRTYWNDKGNAASTSFVVPPEDADPMAQKLAKRINELFKMIQEHYADYRTLVEGKSKE